MRSSEKSQGKVKWQGQAFRGKENLKGGEIIWKSKAKGRNLTSKEEHQKRHQKLVVKKHIKEGRYPPDKTIKMPMSEMSSLNKAIKGIKGSFEND